MRASRSYNTYTYTLTYQQKELVRKNPYVDILGDASELRPCIKPMYHVPAVLTPKTKNTKKTSKPTSKSRLPTKSSRINK